MYEGGERGRRTDQGGRREGTGRGPNSSEMEIGGKGGGRRSHVFRSVPTTFVLLPVPNCGPKTQHYNNLARVRPPWVEVTDPLLYTLLLGSSTKQ